MQGCVCQSRGQWRPRAHNGFVCAGDVLFFRPNIEIILFVSGGEVMQGEIPRIPSGCSIVGIMDTKGRRFNGEEIIQAISVMHDRSNGLGGGFAAYGIYPEFKEHYAFHIMYEQEANRHQTEEYLKSKFMVDHAEMIPVDPQPDITDHPLLWRYFIRLKDEVQRDCKVDVADLVVEAVMHVNHRIPGAFIFSSGKNMGAFKGVGFPEDIGRFFRLEEYEGYLWTAHGRFPTNTPGWWAGAHPFVLLDWSVVHNGEISSYGINKRYLETFGYYCTLQTDTEVVTYTFDLLHRRHGLSLAEACQVMAPPFWKRIDRLNPVESRRQEELRMVYGSAMLNGPFSVIVGYSRGMLALNDRIKLRPMVCARDGHRVYMASEEAAIREVCPNPAQVWAARAGEPVIAELDEGVIL